MILDFPYLYGLYGLHLKTYTLTVKYGKVCFILPSLVFILSGAFQALQTLQNTLIPDQRCSISGFTFVMKPKGRSMKGRSWIAGGQGLLVPLLITKAPAAACQHASMPTQDLLAQKGTSACQTMKPSRTPRSDLYQ